MKEKTDALLEKRGVQVGTFCSVSEILRKTAMRNVRSRTNVCECKEQQPNSNKVSCKIVSVRIVQYV